MRGSFGSAGTVRLWSQAAGIELAAAVPKSHSHGDTVIAEPRSVTVAQTVHVDAHPQLHGTQLEFQIKENEHHHEVLEEHKPIGEFDGSDCPW